MAVRTAESTAPQPALESPPGRAVGAIFVASGAAGLIYQVVWSRDLVLVFGNTTQAISTIVTAFMAGLGLGGLVGGRVADRARRPLRVYALLELAVAVLAFVLPLAFGGLGSLYGRYYGSLVDHPAGLGLLRFGLAALAVTPVTFLAGMTLPVLTRHLVRTVDEAGTRLGALYAANTAGAVAGTLIAGFVLIEFLGLRGTSVVAVALNLVAAAGALALDRRRGAGSALVRRTAATPGPAQVERDAVRPDALGSRQPRQRPVVLLATFVSGFVALALEVLWTRMLAEGTGSSIYVFSAILAIFLAGIAGGSELYRRRSARGRDSLGTLGACLAGVGVVALATVVIGSGVVGSAPFAVRSIVILLPATLLMGYGFPLAGALIVPSVAKTGSSVGLLYATNTAGSILGSFAAAFVLAGTLGTNGSVLLLGAVDLLVGAALLVAARGARPQAARAAAVGLAVLAVAGLVASSAYLPITRTSTQNKLRSAGRTALHSEDQVATVDAVPDARPGARRLLIGGVGVTSLTVDTKVMAYLPKSMRPAARDFLVVAFGMGGTYRSGLIAGLRTDVIELVPSVPGRMPVFFPDAERYLRDPAGRVIVTDGRNYVRLSHKRYDLLAVDPAPPIESAGSVVLYTREFFEQGKARLRPGGIFLEWVPYALPLEDFKTHLRTFRSVFPHVRVLFSPGNHGAYMVGSTSPLALDDASVARTFGAPAAQRDLAGAPDFGVLDGAGWAAELHRIPFLSDAEVDRFVGPGPLITDDHPRSEYFWWRRLGMNDKRNVNRALLAEAWSKQR